MTHATRLVLACAVVVAGAAGCTKPSTTEAPAAGPPASSSAQALRPPATKPHELRGKVEKVDPATRTLTVNAEDVPGWMSGMTMTFGVDKPGVFELIMAGDQISATVYDGDFKTLYDVKVIADKPSR